MGFQNHCSWNASSILDSSHWFHSSCFGIVLSDGFQPSTIWKLVSNDALEEVSSGCACSSALDGTCIGRGLSVCVMMISSSSSSSSLSWCSSSRNVCGKLSSSMSDNWYNGGCLDNLSNQFDVDHDKYDKCSIQMHVYLS